jgi:hypothetical protein
MSHYRVVQGSGIIGTFPNLEAIVASLRGERSGRYLIEEVATAGQVLPSDHSCQKWGTALVMPDGSVELEPERPA